MVENTAAFVTKTQDSNVLLTDWRQLSVHSYVKMLIVGGLFYYLFHLEIEHIVGRWISDSSWSHGFLIPFFGLYFINQHKSEILNLKFAKDPLVGLLHGKWPEPLQKGQTRPDYLGLFFLICGLAFYPVNIAQLRYEYLRPIGMIATLGAIVLFLGGWRLVRYLWLPVVFLAFAVPLPDHYHFALTHPMRLFATQIATVLLNFVSGMEAMANGVIINIIYNGQRVEPSLNVADACSGMRLLMTFVALGVAMAYLHYRPAWERIILLLSTVPIAIFCNVVRVTVTGFIYVLGNPRYAEGIYHDSLGMAMLPLAFGLYGCLAWFMSNLFVEEPQADTAQSDIIVRRR